MNKRSVKMLCESRLVPEPTRTALVCTRNDVCIVITSGKLGGLHSLKRDMLDEQ